MSSKKHSKLLIATIGLIMFLVLGGMFVDFIVYDVFYLTVLFVTLIKYSLRKNI